ncbi:MAG: DUF192 domain-containing protein [Rhodothermales bacterium]
MTLGRNTHIALVALTSVGLMGTLLLGCRRAEQPPAQTEPAFRPDGILAFHDPDGKTIVRIAIEIADTPEAQEIGLMNRRSLPALGGMVFPSDTDRERSFWMKNTPLPLDILFVRADSSIANIARRTTPLSEELIESVGPVRSVVEVRAGFTERYGIDTTSTVSWERRDDSEPRTSELQ